MILTVQIFQLRPDQPDDLFESEFHINDARPDSLSRLAKCQRWAVRNGRSVTVFAKGADQCA